MKIIHITPSYKPAYIYGGPIVSVSSLCESLADANIEICVLTTTANGKNRLKQSELSKTVDGVTIMYFRSINGHRHFSLSLLWRLNQELNAKNKVLHIHSWWNFTAILACLLATMRDTKIILSPRGMLTRYSLQNRNRIIKMLFHKLLGEKLLRKCTIHATSEKEKQDLQELLPAKKITVIANIIKLPPFSKGPLKIRNRVKFNMIFLSRIEQKKGLELLFEALAKLKFRWKLTIAGTGESNYINALKNLASQLQIENHIHWPGFLNHTDKFIALKTHDLLVLFSYNENFGNVILESLHAGTAVAISTETGLSDFVKQNDLGWTCRLEPDCITAALSDAHQNSCKRKRINETGPGLVKHHFNIKTLVGQYLDLYHHE